MNFTHEPYFRFKPWRFGTRQGEDLQAQARESLKVGKAIDAYFVGEPHAAKAELDGSGRVLYQAKDIWHHFIPCVLVVTEKLIQERPAVVRDLVRGIAESGEWAENHRLEAAKVVSPYFRQDEKVVRYVLAATRPGKLSDADVD